MFNTLLIFNRLYGCMLHVRAQLLYNVCPCVIFCIRIYTGSKDIRKLEFNIVEIYSFLTVKSFVTFCTNCIFC